MRLAYASDFHAGLTTDPRLLRQAIDVLARAQADALLLGGDFVSFRSQNIDALAPLLSTVPARLGRYAVLGNHDYMHGGGAVARGLEQAGITMLTNRHVEIGVPGQPLSLCGLDDDLHGRPDPTVAFAGSGPVTVLLMHSPSGLLAAQGHSFRLAICGHIHGGQIALPSGVPIVVPKGELSQRYARGRFELGPERTLIVSRGIGCSGLPVRLFAPPEVTICELRGSPNRAEN